MTVSVLLARGRVSRSNMQSECRSRLSVSILPVALSTLCGSPHRRRREDNRSQVDSTPLRNRTRRGQLHRNERTSKRVHGESSGVSPTVGIYHPWAQITRDRLSLVTFRYVHDLRIEGPFRRMPPFGPVPRLALWYEHCRGDPEFEDSSEREADQFLSRQPLPDSGAFAYINVTGELFGNSI